MRLRTTAPDTADINFLSLVSLEALPELKKYVSACDELSEHIHTIDREIPRAQERHAVLWKAYQGIGSTSLLGQEAQAPEVIDARGEVQALEEQRKVLRENATAARGELTLAEAQLVEKLRPAMTTQLGPPLASLIAGLQACVATERLCGQVQGHGPTRQAVTALLSYLTAVHDHLQGDK